MTDKKLSELTAGAAVAATDLFYSAQDIGGGSFSQVKQPATALRTYVLAGSGGGAPPSGGIAPTQRSVVDAAGLTILSNDQILNVNITAGIPVCTLPAASTRMGVPLTFKDVGGQFRTRPLTLVPAGADLIDGTTSYVMSTAYSGVRLTPLNDGVNSGWSVG